MLELFQYTFFQYAVAGSLLASVICGIVGTYIVTKRLVFISGGITHASLGGIGIGLYAGVSPVLTASVFSIFSGLGIEWLSQKKGMREDSAIAMLWTLGMSIGIIFSYLTPGYVPELTTYLFGNIIRINTTDLAFMAAIAAFTVLFFASFRNSIISIAFDETFAASSGLPVKMFRYIMITIISLSVVSCIRIAGIVLTLSMMTIPINTAALFTHKYTTTVWLSIFISAVTCLGGLIGAYFYNIPSGTSIIFLSIMLYAAARLILSFRKKRTLNKASHNK